MPTQRQNIRILAVALAAGPMDEWESLRERGRPLVGDLRRARWLTSLAKKLSVEFADRPRPSWRQIADRIRSHRPFSRAWERGRVAIVAAPVESQMVPAPGAPRGWDLPEITTLGNLATTLRLHSDDLGWLTAPGQTEHYLYHWRKKPKSGRYRLLEIPKPLLKLTQRSVLRRILECIPPHEAAQGFRSGRSIRDFVAPHTGQQLVLRMDLQDFFPSITATRVMRLFLTAGYPEPVCHALTRLCTNAVPSSVPVERDLNWSERRRLATAHLPQGAPSSPALANLCAFRLDCRLSGLARAAGASYSRYADDLLFSGDGAFARQASRFETVVSAITIEEGFPPNHRKTRLLRPAQRQEAAGLVLNRVPNLRRAEFDRLKAILTNCIRFGPESQNRHHHPNFRAHLEGKISWFTFIHPTRGAKLAALCSHIDWQAGS